MIQSTDDLECEDVLGEFVDENGEPRDINFEVEETDDGAIEFNPQAEQAEAAILILIGKDRGTHYSSKPCERLIFDNFQECLPLLFERCVLRFFAASPRIVHHVYHLNLEILRVRRLCSQGG